MSDPRAMLADYLDITRCGTEFPRSVRYNTSTLRMRERPTDEIGVTLWRIAKQLGRALRRGNGISNGLRLCKLARRIADRPRPPLDIVRVRRGRVVCLVGGRDERLGGPP